MKYLLQNHTRTTSFSILRLSPIIRISSDAGLGFLIKALSSATRTWLSMDVRFFRRFPKRSATKGLFCKVVGVPLTEPSASSNHFSSSGFNLHIFLNERLSASNLDMVVCEKSLPYIFPIASPTSPWVYPKMWKELLSCTDTNTFYWALSRADFTFYNYQLILTQFNSSLFKFLCKLF